MLNLSILLEDSASRYPHKAAFIFGESSFTYTQVNGAANMIANGLRANGIQVGDKVALTCPNVPYFPMIYFGILKAGAVVVPLSILLKTDEVVYHLTDSEAKAYFCFAGTPELPMAQIGHAAFGQVPGCEQFYTIMPKPDMPSTIDGTGTLGSCMAGQSPVFEAHASGADDTCVIVYTSGTTGRPKGAELTHSGLLLNTMVSAKAFEATADDKVLIVLPLFHIFAMVLAMNTGVYAGSTSVMLARFEAETVFETMVKHQISYFAGVPTMYWGLVNHQSERYSHADVAKHLRMAVSGGASLPVKVLEDFERLFGVPIYEGYGMSEGSPVATFNQKQIGRKPGSIGTPIWGIRVKLVDLEGNEVPVGEKGELLYKGHNVMKGYFNKPEATAETIVDGWLHSGDIAIKDEDGFYYIVDRTKDMIIRGGLNVYPREIEELMIQHEAVSLVAVIGIPHEEMGEEIKAFVVLKEDHVVAEADLIAWTRDRIAGYKYPRHVEFMPALPMTATGKILKKELRVL